MPRLGAITPIAVPPPRGDERTKVSEAKVSMKVLAVDDDPLSLLLMEKVMARIDSVELTTLSDGRSALAWLDTDVPDLIIVDQVMPDVGGIELLENLRRRSDLDEVPVVMITADTSTALKIEALEKGCTDFLTKPIIIPEMLARARNLLGLREGRKRLRSHAAQLQAKVDKATAHLREQACELIKRLVRAAEYRDPETGEHIERMARYSGLIAKHLGLDDMEVRQIVAAAPMHDVGKVGIPDAILLKPGRLTDDEMAVMRRHTVMGHAILDGSAHAMVRRAAEIALGHHERFDGTGYPGGLAGEEIPLAARIVAVADVFDALTSPRPYKRAWSLEAAREHIVAGAGSHFDPACVAALVAAWPDVLAVFFSHFEDGSGVGPTEPSPIGGPPFATKIMKPEAGNGGTSCAST